MDRQTDRQKALEMAISQIDKQFGKGSIMQLGDEPHDGHRGHLDRGARRSTSPSASAGCPAGRVVEIFGPESSGKTTLALHVVAEAQRNGGICAFIDAEHAIDPGLRRAASASTSTSC